MLPKVGNDATFAGVTARVDWARPHLLLQYRVEHHLRTFSRAFNVLRWGAAIRGYPRNSQESTRTILCFSGCLSARFTQRVREGYFSRLFWVRAQRWVAPNDTDELAARVRTVVMRPRPIELCVGRLTTYTFGARARLCVLGCCGAADEQAHDFECPAAYVVRERVFSYRTSPGCIAWFLRCTADEGDSGLRAARVYDLLLSAVDAKTARTPVEGREFGAHTCQRAPSSPRQRPDARDSRGPNRSRCIGAACRSRLMRARLRVWPPPLAAHPPALSGARARSAALGSGLGSRRCFRGLVGPKKESTPNGVRVIKVYLNGAERPDHSSVNL